MTQIAALVLAAGEGKRMNSRVTKTLHSAAGRPLLYYPVRAALEAGVEHVRVVVSEVNQAEITHALSELFGAERISTIVQAAPLGTGDAVRAGIAGLAADQLLILCGDTPLVVAEDLRPLFEALESEDVSLSLLSVVPSEPKGYGRILRDASQKVHRIREHRDLQDDAERAVREVNAGMYVARMSPLREALAELRPVNAQGEYYLTDIVEWFAQRSEVKACLGSVDALLGVNDRGQLAEAEAILFERIRKVHFKNGVTLRGTPLIEEGVTIGPDTEIRNGVELRGHTWIGSGVRIGVGAIIIDSEIADFAVIKPYTVIAESKVGPHAEVGPFAHIRPESELDDHCKVGNFVEIKKTHLRSGAKASHLSYLGDGDVGAESNIGAGTIFCNYDGYQKHRTVIGRGVFIGSDSQLVAPVTIGDGAFIATASTVTGDVPAQALVIGRVKPEVKPGYAPGLHRKLAKAAGKLIKQNF